MLLSLTDPQLLTFLVLDQLSIHIMSSPARNKAKRCSHCFSWFLSFSTGDTWEQLYTNRYNFGKDCTHCLWYPITQWHSLVGKVILATAVCKATMSENCTNTISLTVCTRHNKMASIIKLSWWDKGPSNPPTNANYGLMVGNRRTQIWTTLNWLTANGVITDNHHR